MRPRAIAKLLHELSHDGFVLIELRLSARDELSGLAELSPELFTARVVGWFEGLTVRAFVVLLRPCNGGDAPQ